MRTGARTAKGQHRGIPVGFRPPTVPKVRRQKVQLDWEWIIGSHEGRLFILGPYETTQEAVAIGYQKLNCPFSTVSLPTRNRGRAVQMIKARKLCETGDLEKSMERVSHPDV